MPNLQKLKEIIWKANPEILELKFGCEFEDNGIMIGDSMCLYDKDDIDTASDNLDGIGEILGRPITLAAVLLAIEQKFQFYASWTQQTNAILELLLPKYDNGTLVHDAYWDLTKDLEGQSNECIDFISKVLGI